MSANSEVKDRIENKKNFRDLVCKILGITIGAHELHGAVDPDDSDGGEA